MKSSFGLVNTRQLSVFIDRMRSYMNSVFKIINPEVIIWSAALIYLAFLNDADVTHFSICPLSNLGIDSCPGCGLGKSITLFFNGDISGSFNTHLLGIPAVLILTYRIVSLVRFNLLTQKKLNIKERTYNA